MGGVGIPKIIDWKQRDVPHGVEIESEMEMPARNGEAVRVRQFCRKMDMVDSYVLISHSVRNSEPAQTTVITGVKGPIVGNCREDEVESVLLGADGSVQRLDRQTVRVRLDNPYPSLTPEEMLQRVSREAKSGTAQIQKDV